MDILEKEFPQGIRAKLSNIINFNCFVRSFCLARNLKKLYNCLFEIVRQLKRSELPLCWCNMSGDVVDGVCPHTVLERNKRDLEKYIRYYNFSTNLCLHRI